MKEEEKGYKEAMAKVFNEPDRVNFRKLLKDSTGEYDDIDFKEKYLLTHKLAKHILGMSNSGGGVIIFGIREENAGIFPVGIDLKDKTEIETELSNFLPLNLSYKLIDLVYKDEPEWDKIKNKSFQIIIVEYTPENIPFLSKKDYKNIKKQDIYVRKNTSTTKAEYEDIQQILSNRINNSINKNTQNFQEDMERLRLLCFYLNNSYSIMNPFFHEIVKDLVLKKTVKIKKDLDIDF